jgi:hypothetical protein
MSSVASTWYLKVISAVFMNTFIFWNIRSCRPLKVNRHFGGSEAEAALAILLSVIFHGLIFDPEYGGDKFLGNVS